MRMKFCSVLGECLMGFQFWIHPGLRVLAVIFGATGTPSAVETLPICDWQLFHINSGSFPRE